MPRKPLTQKELDMRKEALAKQMAANGQAVPKGFTGFNITPDMQARIDQAVAAAQNNNTVPPADTTPAVTTSTVDTTPAVTTNVATPTGETINTPFGNITIPPGGFGGGAADTATTDDSATTTTTDDSATTTTTDDSATTTTDDTTTTTTDDTTTTTTDDTTTTTTDDTTTTTTDEDEEETVNKEPNFVEISRSDPNPTTGKYIITLRDINPNSPSYNRTIYREAQGPIPKKDQTPGFYDPTKPNEGWDGDYSDNWSSMGATRYVPVAGQEPSAMTIEQLTQMGAQRGYITVEGVNTPIYIYYNPGSSGGTSGIGNIPAMTMVYDNNGYLMTKGNGMPMNAFSPDEYTILGDIPAPGDGDGDPTDPTPEPLPIDPDTGEPFDPIKFSIEQIKKPGLPEGTEFTFTDQKFGEGEELVRPDESKLDTTLSGDLSTGDINTARNTLERNANTYTADQIYDQIKRFYGENNAVDREVIEQLAQPSLKSLVLNEAADEIVARNPGTYTVDASELPSRRGMMSDQPVQILGANGQVIGVVPAGAELPTAATIGTFGSEVLGIAERATSDFVSDEEGARREQSEVTDAEKVAATQGGQILERALGKSTADLNPTELAAAPAVEQLSNIVGEYFPQAVEGDVNALDTVRGQLALLMSDFDDGMPDWAAGSMRVANQVMAERGLGNSSMAAAAIVQAAQEAALPIAQTDAQVYANMNLANLSNKNKFALDNAAAARNFRLQDLSNAQQTELANSVQRYQLLGATLSNYQAAMLANAQMSNALQEQDLSRSQQEQVVNAARFAELENMNLTNEQQARITNEANNLTVDMAELSAKEKAILAELQVQGALEGKELDNIQQVNIIKASRYAENANLDFTAEQTRVFSNSKLLESLNLNNLDYDQARVLQNAANYSQMDMANLNNRQAAQVENAKNFLSMNLANLTNDQQSTILYSQQLQQGLLSDQAAQNAALQFNATSENQVEQFYENLTADIRKFNATQINAMEQFNAGQANAIEQFNTTLRDQREQFNANNALEIEQANVNYRRELNTLNTAGLNAANQQNVLNRLELSNQALSEIWQEYRDTTAYAFNKGENQKDRDFNLMIATMDADLQKYFASKETSANKTSNILRFVSNIFSSYMASSDIRLKTNIVKQKTFNNGLGWYTWNWTEEALSLSKVDPSITEGFIAQEVEKVYPELVSTVDNYLAIMFDEVLHRTKGEE